MIESSDLRSSHFREMRHQDIRPEHLFGRRMEMLTLAVLGQLRARANWHRIAREWMYGEPAGDGAGPAGGGVLRSRRGVSGAAALLRLALLAALVGALFAAVALSGSAVGRPRARRGARLRRAGADRVRAGLLAADGRDASPGRCWPARAACCSARRSGTPISIVAATLGASLAFAISRRFGARARRRAVGPARARPAGLDRRSAASCRCCTRGSCRGSRTTSSTTRRGSRACGWRSFAAATAIGCAPRAFAYIALGGSLSNARLAGGDRGVRGAGGDGDRRGGRRRARHPRSPRPHTVWIWNSTSSPDGRSAGRP